MDTAREERLRTLVREMSDRGDSSLAIKWSLVQEHGFDDSTASSAVSMIQARDADGEGTNWFAVGFSFSGRIGVGRYWAYWGASLAFWGASLALLGVIFLLGLPEPFLSAKSAGGTTIGLLLWILLSIPLWLAYCWVNGAALVKRFRDAGLSFWWLLLVFVPVGGLIPFVMALAYESKSPRFWAR